MKYLNLLIFEAFQHIIFRKAQLELRVEVNCLNMIEVVLTEALSADDASRQAAEIRIYELLGMTLCMLLMTFYPYAYCIHM